MKGKEEKNLRRKEDQNDESAGSHSKQNSTQTDLQTRRETDVEPGAKGIYRIV